MIREKLFVISFACLFLLYLDACNSGTSTDNNLTAADSAIIAKGEVIFNRHCSGCHNFRFNGIGPHLGGLTTKVSAKWIYQFIKDPQKIINSGDERAQHLYKKYRTVMPSFTSFTGAELKEIYAFLNIHSLPVNITGTSSRIEITDPVPEKIKTSNLIVELKLLTQIPPSTDSGTLPLTRITKLDYQPDTGILFILDLRGKLYKLNDGKPVVYMNMATLRPKFIHEPGLANGFGSFTFHPKFASNGLLYTTHTESAASAKADFDFNDSIKVTLQWVLTEWKTDNPAASVFSGTGKELFRVDMVAGVHGVQEITFNPVAKPGDEDYGLLYIGIGDGGSVENGYPFLTHSTDKIWGTILRLDPAGRNSANGRYGIPLQNPFAATLHTKTLREIYAYGFRNPHRITWSKQGQMLACNIGHGDIESIDLVQKGHNYGWPLREGSFVIDPSADLNKVYPLPANDSSFHITYPVAEYDHDEGKAISGGFEYSGTTVPGLKGKFLFGDIPTGRLFYIDMADVKAGGKAVIKEWKVSVNGTVKSLAELCESKRVDLHFGKDISGELYILTKPEGKVYKLISATE